MSFPAYVFLFTVVAYGLAYIVYKNSDNPKLLGRASGLFIGIAVGATAVVVDTHEHDEYNELQKSGESAVGTIIRYQLNAVRGKNPATYCPVIQFSSKDGSVHTGEIYAGRCLSKVPASNAEQTVDVTYDSRNPEIWRVMAWQHRGGRISTYLGLLIIVLTIFVFFPRRKSTD